MSAFCPESCPDADACVVGFSCALSPANQLTNHELNVYVWVVGGKYRYPQGLYGDDEFIYKFIKDNPRVIVFFGPRGIYTGYNEPHYNRLESP